MARRRSPMPGCARASASNGTARPGWSRAAARLRGPGARRRPRRGGKAGGAAGGAGGWVPHVPSGARPSSLPGGDTAASPGARYVRRDAVRAQQRARRLLAAAWRAGEVERDYRALVEGRLGDGERAIDVPIGKVPHAVLGNVWAACPTGRPARTWVRSLGPRPDAPSGGESIVALRLDTGRPHQIRIHLAAIGHPLVGDPLYAAGGVPRPDARALPGDGGYRLHADRLAFPHPATGARIVVACAPPPVLRVPAWPCCSAARSSPRRTARRRSSPICRSAIHDGDRIGLVGPNGSGKSTLLRSSPASRRPTPARVALRRLTRVGYVPQHPAFAAGAERRRARRRGARGRTSLDDVERDTRVARRRSAAAASPIPAAAAGDALGRLAEAPRDRARARAARPTCCCIDEPTNHLDLDGILWLEELLRSRGRGVPRRQPRPLLPRARRRAHARARPGATPAASSRRAGATASSSSGRTRRSREQAR